MMRVFLCGEKDRLEAAALDIAREEGFWLFKTLSPSSLPSHWMFEISVGDAAMDLQDGDVGAAFQALLERARAVL